MISQTVLAKKRRGPAPTGKGEQVVVRMHAPELPALDAWIAQQPDPKPSRPEVVRIAVRDWLTSMGLIQFDVPLESRIADQKALIAAIPSPAGPSPEAGLATMDRAIAENDLAHLKLQRAKRERARRG